MSKACEELLKALDEILGLDHGTGEDAEVIHEWLTDAVKEHNSTQERK